MNHLDSIEQIDGHGQPQIGKQSLFLYDFRVNRRDRLCLATVVAEQNRLKYVWTQKLGLADSISEHYYYHCDVYNQSHNIQTPNSKQPTKVQRFEI